MIDPLESDYLPGNLDSETLVPSRRRSVESIGFALYWAGVALIVSMAIAMTFMAFPLQLAQPEWIQRMIEALISYGGNALIGAALTVAALGIERGQGPRAKQIQWIRRLSAWAAIGWALLIPLQFYTGITLLQGAKQQDRTVIRSLIKARTSLQLADDRQQIEAIVQSLPGVPPNLRIVGDQGRAKREILEQLDQRIKEAENNAAVGDGQRWQAWLKQATNRSLAMLMMAVGFAAIGQSAPNRPTLLENARMLLP
jgi:hypothetical protein